MGWMAAKTARTVTNTSAMVAVSLSIRGPHHVVPVEAEPCPPVDPTSENVDQGRDDDYRGRSAHRGKLGCLSGRAPHLRNRCGFRGHALGCASSVLKVGSRL